MIESNIMNTKFLSLNSVVLILLVSISSITVAKDKLDVSLEDASEYIRAQSNGKVMSARTTNFNGLKMHRIQVLEPSGRVKVFQVPANRSHHKNGMESMYNGQILGPDRNKKPNNYYQNNSNRSRNASRNTSRNSNASRYIAPKNYSHPNSSIKGDSKQK